MRTESHHQVQVDVIILNPISLTMSNTYGSSYFLVSTK